MGGHAEAASALERVVREDWGRVLAALVASTRRLDLAEDALGDAVATAAERWPRDGVPEHPDAWLLTTARRRVIDHLRAEAVALRRAPELVVEGAEGGWTASSRASEPHRLEARAAEQVPDDRLRLLFLCAHPALDAAARAALSLRLVLGVPTEVIARLFLVQHTAMSARLTRAKKRIVSAGLPLALPSPAQREARVETVLRCSYLTFTAGYRARGLAPDDPDMAGLEVEAIRLTRVVRELMPDEPGAASLLALQLLQHSRRDTRSDAEGRLVLLAAQDRTRWDRAAIREAAELLDVVEAASRAGAGTPMTPYARTLHLEALIAFEHARAGVAASTDWSRIAVLYADLEALTGSAVVRLNRAVALAEASGPGAGLALLEDWPGGVGALDAALGAGHRLPFVHADLLDRAGRPVEALTAASLALDRCPPGPERDHVAARVATLRQQT